MAVRTIEDYGVKKVDSSNPITALVAVVNQLATGMNTLTAKLNADGGVTDTNYDTAVGTIDTLAVRSGQTPT